MKVISPISHPGYYMLHQDIKLNAVSRLETARKKFQQYFVTKQG